MSQGVRGVCDSATRVYDLFFAEMGTKMQRLYKRHQKATKGVIWGGVAGVREVRRRGYVPLRYGGMADGIRGEMNP